MTEKLCPQLKIKLQELKSLKIELDLELEKVGKKRDTNDCFLIKKKIVDVLVEIESEIVRKSDPHRLSLRKAIAQKIGAEYMDSFHENRAIVCRSLRNEDLFFVDNHGNRIELEEGAIPFERFSEGRAVAGKNGKRFVIDENGKRISEDFDRVSEYHEGFAIAVVDVEGGKSKEFYIDLDGKRLNNETYEYAGAFSEGFARVKIGEEYYYLNREGKKEFGPFNFAGDFQDGLAWVSAPGSFDKFYIDKEGNDFFGEKFQDCREFHEGFAGVKKNDVWYFIDKSGRNVFQKEFELVRNFSEGLAGIRIGEKWGFINDKGEIVIQCQFRRVSEFNDGLAEAEVIKGKSFYIDKNGRDVFGKVFDNAADFSGGLAIAGNDNDKKMYAFNAKGEIVFEIEKNENLA